MLTVDIGKKFGYDFYCYFFRDFSDFLKLHGKNNIISYYEPLENEHDTRYVFYSLSLDNGKDLYSLLKLFLENSNIDIKEVGVYYE